MRSILPPTLILLLSAPCAHAGEKVAPPLTGEDDRVSYAIGYQVGGDMRRQGVALNPEAMVRGVRAGMAGGGGEMSAVEIRDTLVALKQRITAAQRQQKMRELERARDAGRAFLAANAEKEGVVTLPSGLQYRVVRAGSGKSPGPTDTVTVHYRGTKIDGTEFDSSYRRGEPATFPVGGVIKGWTEALQLMKEGAKWELFIPPDLAYNERGPLADQTLLFEVELISVQPAR